MTSPAPENIPAEPKSPARSRTESLNISSSVCNLRFINDELRSHVTKLRNQLEAEKGNLKQAHRQKVLDIKNVREQEQKKALATIIELKKKFHEEKIKEMESVRETISQKLELEKNKSLKVKDTEMIKLKQELDVKEKMLNKLLSQTNQKTSNDQIKVKLLDELSELRSTKRQLEESLSQATVIEKHHSENLKKLCSSYESELVRVRREAHMEIRHMIEELKTKEKHIAQLEQDLGHQSGYMMQLEKKISSQDKGPNPSSPGGATTPSKTPTTAHNYSPSKDSDGNQQTNLKENSSCQNSKSKVPGYLTRKSDKENSTFLAQIRSLQQKISEQYKTINALRQACSEKDRRIELIQHRKMKKRLRRSLEKCSNTNGDDDACSVDSEVSVSSLPMDNGTEDSQLDIWDEYAREEIERSYRQLMREHLELKKSYTLLQAQTSSALDPERELKLCRTLESDLFEAQCKIEELKALLQTDGLEPRLLEEKETLQSANIEMQKKLKMMEDNEGKLQEDLSEAKEQIEDLEFRILELEESQNMSQEDGNDALEDFLKLDNTHQLSCDEESGKTSFGVKRSLFREERKDAELASLNSNGSGEDEQLLREEVNSLRKQIIELTERPVMDFPPKPTEIKTEAVYPTRTKDGKNLQESKQRIEELEKIAIELQGKIIGLQQDKVKLEEQLSQKSCTSLKLDKIKALEEADIRNSRKLVELQEDENHLRESLRCKDDLSDQSELLKTLKKKIKDLEKSNKLLKNKVVELEDSNCEMREHWNQIVEVDANKIEGLQEKMKMLESLNKELEKKLQEGEEEFMTGVSLASELSFSQDPPDSKESTVSFDLETEYKNLEEKFQEVTEAKNSKIAELEDHLEKLYSTEQKLSETIAEMEERERELLAKLKLCENSDFSVEKMLNYEERIKELSYSQENLLNAIDTVADPESHSLQIINALKEELVLSYQKNEINLKEKKLTEHLRNENNSLKDQLDKLIEKESSQILSAEKGKDTLHNEHSLVPQNNKQEVPTSSLFVRIQELEIENQELRAKVDGSQNGTHSKVSSTVSSNYERLCELEKENSNLLAEASRLHEAESQWKETAEKVVQLESNEERLMEKVVELEDSCESLKEELRKVHGDKKESQSELKEEQEKVGSLLKLEAEIKGRLQAEEELNSSLREQLQSFRLRLEEIKDAYADHENSKMELEKKLEEVTRDKNLLAEKLQSLTKNQIIPVDSKDPNQNSADHDILEHSSVSLSDSTHSSANTNSLPFHSTENKYLGLINSLEASLKDIGSNKVSSEIQDNKQGPITEQASKSKEKLSKELESELADMNREQLIDFCSTLKTDLITKSQKMEEFERDFSDFVSRVQCGTVVFRDKEVRKTVLTEVKTFQQQCNCKVPINMHTTLAGEKVSQGVDTADLLINNVTEQQQQQQKDANDTMMAHIDMPHSEYEVWKAKVAILTDIEANLPNVKEFPHQLELLLQILQKGRDIICSDEDQVGISNDELLIYAKQFQTLSQGLNSTTSPDGTGTGTDAGKEVSQVKMEQLGAGKEVKGPCSKTPGLFNIASKSDRKKVIKELISNLPPEDLVVVAQIVKQRLAKGKVKRTPNDQSNPSMSNEQKEFEEVEVDMWLSSEDEDEQPTTAVEQVQAGTDSVSNAAAAALPCTVSNTATTADETTKTSTEDEWKPPLPKSPPPDQPPTLLDEPEVIFVDNNDVTDKHLTEAEPTLPSATISQQWQEQQHIPQTANTNDQSKQQVNLLTKALNDKNKYITMLEASIERLGQMLAQPHGANPDTGVREEAIKKLESQLKSLQQELRQHHVEGQQSLTSLRTQLQGNTDISNTQKRQSFPQCHTQKQTPLAHSYSTTDLSRISFSASDMENLLKMPHPVRAWPSCSHLAPQTFSRTVRRRSDTFDPKLLPAGQQQQQQQQHQHQLLLQGNHGNIPVSTFSGWSSDKTTLHHLQQQQPKSQMLATNSLFVAASDYSPELFSASGHLHLEIPLKEGDVIIKKGPVGANGYCEALVKGKVGLVPYKYLHPVKLETMTAEEQRALHLQFRGDTTEKNTEHMIPLTEVGSYFQKAHLASIPNIAGSQYLQPEHSRWNNSVSTTPPRTAVSATPTTSPASQFVKRHSSGSGGNGGHISHTPVKGLPEAPSTFRLERIVGDNSVLLSWHPPMMDELDQNNGMQLIGYRIFLNGRLCQQPGSAHLAKAVVENLDLSRPQYFAIQSVAANGQMSPSAEVVFEGLERWLDVGDRSTESDTDLSEILPSHLGNPGPQRTFVAIYDYNPSMQSPHDYAESELRFKAGDLITVFGNQRSDGFFWAELNGSQGLVPASFVEEVPMKGSRSKPVSRQNSNASQKSLQNTVGRTSR